MTKNDLEEAVLNLLGPTLKNVKKLVLTLEFNKLPHVVVMTESWGEAPIVVETTQEYEFVERKLEPLGRPTRYCASLLA